jgi:hypothetical protein
MITGSKEWQSKQSISAQCLQMAAAIHYGRRSTKSTKTSLNYTPPAGLADIVAQSALADFRELADKLVV